ncbi:hypothetical protein OUI_1079 [Helicobacter pylori R036d]|uniref:Uncharacterized protein n=1 Tax=Helicobacter pylori R036d TaxID=1145113 RepID=K2L7Y8_HELPX|nr:hypothetical protein OUI_1079 [Helicobacter pylori R036d]
MITSQNEPRKVLDFKKYLGVFLTCCDLIENQNFSVRLVIM